MKPSLKAFLPSLAVLFALTLCATDIMAQGGNRGGNRGDRQHGGGNGGGEVNLQRLLRSGAVQRELELTEGQIELLGGSNKGGDRDRGGNREAREAELEGLSDERPREKIT